MPVSPIQELLFRLSEKHNSLKIRKYKIKGRKKNTMGKWELHDGIFPLSQSYAWGAFSCHQQTVKQKEYAENVGILQYLHRIK